MDDADLDELISEIEDVGEEFLAGEARWSDFWNKVVEARTAFRDIRYPSRAEKDDARNHLESIVSSVKERQAEQSEELKSEYMEELDGVDVPSEFNSAIGDLFTGVIRGLFPIQSDDHESQQETLLKMASDEMREIRERFKQDQWRCTPSDRQEIWDRYNELKERLDEAWNRLKRAKLEFEIERLQEKVEKTEGFIDAQRQRIQDLEDEYSETSSESYGEKLQERIEEAREKIESAEANIERWKSKIYDLESRISDLG